MLELPRFAIMCFSCMFWQIVTNGIYRSIEHRAIVNSVKEILSMATFYSPKWEDVMGPAPSLITLESPRLFKRIGAAYYFRGYFSRKLDGKSYIDVMRIHNDEQKGSRDLPFRLKNSITTILYKEINSMKAIL
jgi:isopenicillin N synthase-like dioxygenase